MEFEIKNTKLFILAPQNETFKYKSSKICTRSICGNVQNSDERNQITKLFVRYSMIKDRNTQYCQDVISS